MGRHSLGRVRCRYLFRYCGNPRINRVAENLAGVLFQACRFLSVFSPGWFSSTTPGVFLLSTHRTRYLTGGLEDPEGLVGHPVEQVEPR